MQLSRGDVNVEVTASRWYLLLRPQGSIKSSSESTEKLKELRTKFRLRKEEGKVKENKDEIERKPEVTKVRRGTI